MLHWYRSWPKPHHAPALHARIEDNLPRLYIRTTTTALPSGPRTNPGSAFLSGTSLSPVGRERFAELALQEPDRPLVAPYVQPFEDFGPQFVHRLKREQPDESLPPRWQHWRPIERLEDEAELFGFGCVYLPRALIEEFKHIHRGRTPLNDTSFSYWYLARGTARVTWFVRPQHLHGD